MKDKNEKKPLDSAPSTAKPETDAPKQETPGAADKPATDPGAGKEEKELDAPAAGEGADAAQTDGKDAGGKEPGDDAKGAEAGAQGAEKDAGAVSGETAGKGSGAPDKGVGGSSAAPDGDAAAEAAPDKAAYDESAPDEAAPGADPEKIALRRELLAARSQLAAYGAGVAPEMITDAVTLATAEAEAAGNVSAESIAKAMDGVLKRHPEWKTGGDGSGGAKKAAGAGPVGALNRVGGFKLGVDPGGFSSAGGEGAGAKNVKRWNRFK